MSTSGSEKQMAKQDQLKRNYRSRYYREKAKDLPDLQPGNKLFSAIRNYFDDLNVDASLSSSSFSAGKSYTEIHNRKQTVEGVSTINSASDSLQHNRVKTNVLTNKLVDILMSADTEKKHAHDVKNSEKLFSDESEEEENDVIPSLIEDLNDAASESGSQSPKSSAKSREQLYSSDSSVVQDLPSPSSSLVARKCLSFKDSSLTKNANMVSKVSEKKLVSKISVDELENRTQTSRLHEAVETSVKKYDATKAPVTLYTENRQDEEDEEFLISEETSKNLKSWVTPSKNKRTPEQRRSQKYKLISATEPKVNLGKHIDFQRQKSEIIRESAIVSMDRRSTLFASDPSSSVAVKPANVDSQIDNVPDYIEDILPSMKSKAVQNIRTTERAEISVNNHNVQINTDLPQENHFEKHVLVDEEFYPEEMATANFLDEDEFLEGAQHQKDTRQTSTERKTEEHVKNVDLLQAKSDIPKEHFFGEHLSQEETVLTNKMLEVQQSKEKRQSSRKMLFAQMISDFESNKAALSKSRSVIESVDEEFDIVDLSNIHQAITLPGPVKSKSMKSFTESKEMSVQKQNGQGISQENSMKDRSSKKIPVKNTLNNDVSVREIGQKHFQSDEESSDSSYSFPEETTRIQISKKRNCLEERNSKPGPSNLQEWKTNVHVKKGALTQAKASIDEVPLIRDPLPKQKSNLSNKKPNQQSKQRLQNSKPRAQVQQIVSSDIENKKSSATSKSRGRELKSILSDEVEMPVLETNLSADSSRNVVTQMKSIPRRSKRVSLPPGIWWSVSGEPVKGLLNKKRKREMVLLEKNKKQSNTYEENEESGPVQKQANSKLNRKSVYVPKSKKGKGEQNMKGKEEKLLQTRKAKKGVKEQTNKGNNNSKLLETSSDLKQQRKSNSPSPVKGCLPEGSDDILETDNNLSQASTVQGACNVNLNLSRKRKHVDESDKAQISPKKKLKSILKKKSKGSPEFKDAKHLDIERLEDGNSTDESQESRTDLLSNYQSQQNYSSSPYLLKYEKMDSVFQSGPVLKSRPVEITSPVKPLVCALNSPEPQGEENLDHGAVPSTSYNQSEALVGDENCTINNKIDKNEQLQSTDTSEDRTLNIIPIVWDPDTESDAVVDCIHPHERSTFLGNENFKIWTSYQHNMFTTGKLKLAPLKKKVNTASMFDIITYYVANGLVKLTLHKSDYTLKTGDLFFIPPGNAHTIRNLQNEEAMLTFTIVSISGVTPT